MALYASCDVFVSLHRAEGFGLTIAEAMALGKPTIATAYSANMDFTTPGNSYLVRYDLVRLEEAEGLLERASRDFGAVKLPDGETVAEKAEP